MHLAYIHTFNNFIHNHNEIHGLMKFINFYPRLK
jgi:hypothetical protein